MTVAAVPKQEIQAAAFLKVRRRPGHLVYDKFNCMQLPQ